jgi:mannitol-1-phosphate 5-dehydrogenase
MVNPFLHDRVDRVTRDPRRKLGWDDRLVGTMRMVRQQGLEPVHFATGAAAAVEMLLEASPREFWESLLHAIWGKGVDADEQNDILALIRQARDQLQSL